MTDILEKNDTRNKSMINENEAPMDTATEILKKISEAWPSPIVLRKDIGKFSCGLVTHRSMEVADQRGYGVSDRIIINGKVAYKKEAVLKWLEDRAKPLQIDERKKATPRPHKNDILLGK